MDDSQNAAQTGVIRTWLLKPFNESMDVLHWFVFLGFVIIASFFWKQVLNHIVEGV